MPYGSSIATRGVCSICTPLPSNTKSHGGVAMHRSHVEATYVTRQEARNLLSAAQWLSELHLTGPGALQDALVGAIVGQVKLDEIQLLQVVRTPDLDHKDLAATDFCLDCTEDLATVHDLQASSLVNVCLNVESTNVSQSTWDRAVHGLQGRQTAAGSDKLAEELCSERQALRTLVKLWSLGTAYGLLQPIKELLSAHSYSMTVLQPLVAQLQQPHAAQVDSQQPQHAAAAPPGQLSSTLVEQESMLELAQQLLQNMSSEVVSSLLTLLKTAHTTLLQLPLTDSRLQAAAATMHAQLQTQKRKQERPQHHHAVTDEQAAGSAPNTESGVCIPGREVARQKQLKRPAAAMIGSSEAAAADVHVAVDATDDTATIARGPSGKQRKADSGLENQQPCQPKQQHQQQQRHDEQGLGRADSGSQKRQREVRSQAQAALQQQQQQSQQPLQPAAVEWLQQQQQRLPQHPCEPRCRQHPPQQSHHKLPPAAAFKGDLPAMLQKLQQLAGLRHQFCLVLVNRMKALDRPRLSHVEVVDIVTAELQELAPFIQVPGLVEAYIEQDPAKTFVLLGRTSPAGSQPSRRLADAGLLVEVDPVVCRQFGAKFNPCAEKVDTCKCRFGDSCRFSHLC